jgi:hypothetical protein
MEAIIVRGCFTLEAERKRVGHLPGLGRVAASPLNISPEPSSLRHWQPMRVESVLEQLFFTTVYIGTMHPGVEEDAARKEPFGA